MIRERFILVKDTKKTGNANLIIKPINWIIYAIRVADVVVYICYVSAMSLIFKLDGKMKTQEYQIELAAAKRVGEKYIGKTAQSNLLTMIGSKGQKVFEPAQKITGYEVVDMFGEPTLILIIGGESVLESTVFNVK
jgi:nucleoside recognition membrane protein YjiH